MAAPEDLESPSYRIEFAVDPSKVLRTLLVVVALLVLLSIAGQAMVHSLPDFPLRDALARFFYVDEEQSLPTLYSVVMLIASALLLAIIAHATRRASRPYVGHWATLSLVFVFLAVDEFASLHEKAIMPLREFLDIESGPLWYAWVIPGALAVGIFVVMFARFLRHLPPPTRRGLSLAGALFVGGALGVELLGGWYASAHGQDTMAFALIATAEETLEMLGIAVVVYTVLTYVAVSLEDAVWRVRIASPD